MKFVGVFYLLLIQYSLSFAQDATIYRSSHDFETSIHRLDSIIKAKKLTYHKILNYDREIKKKEIIHSRVFVFEDDKLSENILACSTIASLDLPLKILVWNDGEEVFLSYVDPHFMKRRFQIKDCNDKLHDITKLLVRITNECIKK